MTSATTWPPRNITGLELQLNLLAEAVSHPPDSRSDDEKVWLTRFLLVRAVGYLEQVVVECFREHIQQRSYGTVRSFSISYLDRSQNPSIDNLLSALGRLDARLRDEFEEWIDEDDQLLRRDLAAAVARRHQIAHGLNEGIGPQRALQHVENLTSVADWFIRKLDPHPQARPSRQFGSRGA